MALKTPQLPNIKLPDMKMPDLKAVDWRKLASYANPQSVKDLDVFLDKLPARAGMNGIIAAGVIWAIAGAALLLAYTKSADLREIRGERDQAEAVMPTVPTVAYTPIADTLIRDHVEKLKNIYKNLTIDMSSGVVSISSTSTRDFPAWRAAIGDLAYGGNGWRLQVKEFCAGRECPNGKPLHASLSVQQMDITLPDAPPET